MTYTFTELDEQFRAAVDWFSARGALVNQSRLGVYHTHISELAAWHNSDVLDQNISNENGYFYRRILFEIMEILEIYQSLRLIASDDILRRVQNICQGPLFLGDETDKSNSARNYQFELLVAARFKHAGFNVVLTDNDDFAIQFMDGLMPFECKRPQSSAQVEKRIKRGCEQLKRRYKALPADARHKGILVVSIDKLNRNFSYLVRSQHRDDALNLLKEKCNLFHQTHLNLVLRRGRGGVGGFLVVINVPGEISKRLTYAAFSSLGYWANSSLARDLRKGLNALSQSTME